MTQHVLVSNIARNDEPIPDRPYMPDYGIKEADEGTGLLPWSWAEERLVASHDYWIASSWPDGRPHVMPIWGVWAESVFWFSCGGRSRKARNLVSDSRCVVTTDDARNPVVLEGIAQRVENLDAIARFARWTNEKYDENIPTEFFTANATFIVRPKWAFGLVEGDFTGSPTRWSFPER
jgi:hypothetical protein